MKISFDFDGTLTDVLITKLAKRLVHRKHEVFIVTSRLHYTLEPWQRVQNNEVFEKAKKLCIKPSNVYFTEYEDKYKLLDELGIDVHYDDQISESNNAIQNNAKVKIVII